MTFSICAVMHEEAAYSKRQIYLPFTIEDAHDFCKEDSAFRRSKNRRGKRHKEKIYDVSYTSSAKYEGKWQWN